MTANENIKALLKEIAALKQRGPGWDQKARALIVRGVVELHPANGKTITERALASVEAMLKAAAR